MEIGFDLIGDLNLDPEDSFNWEGKATSLYCLVAGNVSEDLRTVVQTLAHLSRFYQGVFYVPGLLEYKTAVSHAVRTKELNMLVKKLPKVALLWHHVVIIDGVAILGANGWNADDPDTITAELVVDRLEDIAYLNSSVQKLQTHGDVKRILLVTACVPRRELYFGKIPSHTDDHIYPEACLAYDTEMKVTHWAFGGSDVLTNTVYHGVTYVNNPYRKEQPYWAARIAVTL